MKSPDTYRWPAGFGYFCYIGLRCPECLFRREHIRVKERCAAFTDYKKESKNMAMIHREDYRHFNRRIDKVLLVLAGGKMTKK